MLKYSVVIPVYNSENTLRTLCSEIIQTLNSQLDKIIFVNDFSIDNSWNILCELKKEYPKQVKAINLSKNAGQHTALLCGFQFVNRCDWVITIDDDLQTPPKEISKLIQKSKEGQFDVIYGIYEKKQHSKIRNAGSLTFAKIFTSFASTPPWGSSFKLINYRIIDEIKKHHHLNVYIDEIIAWYSTNTTFTKVEHHTRKEGKSNYSPLKLIKMAVDILINYTTAPLRLISVLGVLSFILSLILGGFYIYQKITFGSEPGYTSIIVSILFSTGLILFSLGIIGNYLSRIFLMQSNKPSYSVKEVI